MALLNIQIPFDQKFWLIHREKLFEFENDLIVTYLRSPEYRNSFWSKALTHPYRKVIWIRTDLIVRHLGSPGYTDSFWSKALTHPQRKIIWLRTDLIVRQLGSPGYTDSFWSKDLTHPYRKVIWIRKWFNCNIPPLSWTHRFLGHKSWLIHREKLFEFELT